MDWQTCECCFQELQLRVGTPAGVMCNGHAMVVPVLFVGPPLYVPLISSIRPPSTSHDTGFFYIVQ